MGVGDECGSFRGACDLLLLVRVLSGKHREQKLNVAVQKIVPGQYNAVLEMADGATYQLGEQQYFLQERTGNQIKVDSTV